MVVPHELKILKESSVEDNYKRENDRYGKRSALKTTTTHAVISLRDSIEEQ